MKPLQSLAGRAGTWWKARGAGVLPTSGRISLRPHVSTFVLLLPVLAVLVLANWPGWRVAFINPFGPNAFEPSLDAHYEHGWPLIYLRRETSSSNGPTYVIYSAWNLRSGILEFKAPALAGDLIASIAVLALAGLLIEARRRRRHSCFQFYLRELLILITVAAIGLSFWAARRQRYQDECAIYTSLCNEQNGPVPDWSPNGSSWCLEGPDWLLPLIGEARYCELFARLRASLMPGWNRSNH